MLNFARDARQAMLETGRVGPAGGTVGAYVWGYSNGMRMMRYFWDSAVDLDPPIEPDGRIQMVSRAWAIKGTVTRWTVAHVLQP